MMKIKVSNVGTLINMYYNDELIQSYRPESFRKYLKKSGFPNFEELNNKILNIFYKNQRAEIFLDLENKKIFLKKEQNNNEKKQEEEDALLKQLLLDSFVNSIKGK